MRRASDHPAAQTSADRLAPVQATVAYTPHGFGQLRSCLDPAPVANPSALLSMVPQPMIPRPRSAGVLTPAAASRRHGEPRPPAGGAPAPPPFYDAVHPHLPVASLPAAELQAGMRAAAPPRRPRSAHATVGAMAGAPSGVRAYGPTTTASTTAGMAAGTAAGMAAGTPAASTPNLLSGGAGGSTPAVGASASAVALNAPSSFSPTCLGGGAGMLALPGRAKDPSTVPAPRRAPATRQPPPRSEVRVRGGGGAASTPVAPHSTGYNGLASSTSSAALLLTGTAAGVAPPPREPGQGRSSPPREPTSARASKVPPAWVGGDGHPLGGMSPAAAK